MGECRPALDQCTCPHAVAARRRQLSRASNLSCTAQNTASAYEADLQLCLAVSFVKYMFVGVGCCLLRSNKDTGNLSQTPQPGVRLGLRRRWQRRGIFVFWLGTAWKRLGVMQALPNAAAPKRLRNWPPRRRLNARSAGWGVGGGRAAASC